MVTWQTVHSSLSLKNIFTHWWVKKQQNSSFCKAKAVSQVWELESSPVEKHSPKCNGTADNIIMWRWCKDKKREKKGQRTRSEVELRDDAEWVRRPNISLLVKVLDIQTSRHKLRLVCQTKLSEKGYWDIWINIIPIAQYLRKKLFFLCLCTKKSKKKKHRFLQSNIREEATSYLCF